MNGILSRDTVLREICVLSQVTDDHMHRVQWWNNTNCMFVVFNEYGVDRQLYDAGIMLYVDLSDEV
jgi:hypothetical protein